MDSKEKILRICEGKGIVGSLWIDDSFLSLQIKSKKLAILKANKNGLVSLAMNLLELSNREDPEFFEIYLDRGNQLTEDSIDMGIYRLKNSEN